MMTDKDNEYLHYYVNLCLDKHEAEGKKYGWIAFFLFVCGYISLVILIISRT